MAIYVNLFVVQIRTCSSQLRNCHTSVLATICLHIYTIQVHPYLFFLMVCAVLHHVPMLCVCICVYMCVCMCMDGLLRRRLQICIDITCMDQKPVYMDPWSKYV